MKSTTRVNIRKLKIFVFERLPSTSILRDILLSERDELDVNEFLTKLEVWLKLLRSEK